MSIRQSCHSCLTTWLPSQEVHTITKPYRGIMPNVWSTARDILFVFLFCILTQTAHLVSSNIKTILLKYSFLLFGLHWINLAGLQSHWWLHEQQNIRCFFFTRSSTFIYLANCLKTQLTVLVPLTQHRWTLPVRSRRAKTLTLTLTSNNVSSVWTSMWQLSLKNLFNIANSHTRRLCSLVLINRRCVFDPQASSSSAQLPCEDNFTLFRRGEFFT